MSLSSKSKISGLPRVSALANEYAGLLGLFVWVVVVFIRLISLAMVSMNVLGLELAMSVNELRATLHRSAIGVNGRCMLNLFKKKKGSEP